MGRRNIDAGGFPRVGLPLIAQTFEYKKGDLYTIDLAGRLVRVGIGTDGQFIVADSTKPSGWVWKTLVGPVANIGTGADRNRPAAAAGIIYITTDTFQTYASTGSLWTVAGVGPDNCLFTGGGGGFSDTNYLASPNSTLSGPTMTNPYTALMGFYVVSLPGNTGGVIYGYGSGNITSGWLFANSTVNSNKLRIYMQGVNSNANIEINLTLTTGFHVVAFNYNGSSIRYCMDGGSVGNVSVSGTYVAPSASAVINVGRFWFGAGFSAPWLRMGFIQGYSSVLSDADMQTLSGSPSTFIPGTITTAPDFDWQARWYRAEGVSGAVSQYNFFGTASNTSSFLNMIGSGVKIINAS